eukprot:g25932.t1
MSGRPVKTVVALWAFEAQNEQEISFKQGDQIQVITAEGDGWWEGMNAEGQRGLFPSNYVETVMDENMTTVSLTPINGAGVAGKPQSSSASNFFAAGAASDQRVTKRFSTTMARYANEEIEVKDTDNKIEVQSRRVVNSNTRYGMWAHNQGLFTGWALVSAGVVLIMWCISQPQDYNWKAGLIGLYAVLVGAFVFYFEKRAGSNLQHGKFPWRCFCYLVITMPLWLPIPTRFAAGACAITALTYLASFLKGEEFQLQGADRPGKSVATLQGKIWLDLYARLVEEDRLGIVIWISLFMAANLIHFIYTLHVWKTSKGVGLGPWVPWAKAFGACLNLDIVTLLLSVCRTPIRYILDWSTANQTRFSRSVRCLVKYVVPLDHAIAFHILVAYTVLGMAIGHTVCHFMNYVAFPAATWAKFGAAPWITGALLFACILLMHAATMRNVKSTHFEIFWYSHQLFTVFFVCCLLHGAGWWGPNFWKYLIGPGTLYACERIYREYYSSLGVPLMSATFMKPSVFRLELARAGPLRKYKEGQYAYINCPIISRTEWHPFTISSAPQDKSVTFHIRVQAAGSWTAQVQDMLKGMGKKDAAVAEFTTRTTKDGKTEVRLGKTSDPMGRRFFRIYGPHAAPTQHLSEYHTAMVVGSGIGITPLHACLKSVVFHRWKYTIGKSYPDRVFFHWIFSYNEMSSFRWFVRAATEACDAVAAMGSNLGGKRFEIHIHMTSAPKDRDKSKPFQMEKPSSEMSDEEDVAFWGVRVQSTDGLAAVPKTVLEDDLYCWLMNPPNKEQTFGDYLTLHEGRPNWPNIFKHVNEQHQAYGDVGVLFCGNPMVAEDLKEQCQVFSDAKQGKIFRLHKENF